MNSELTRLSAAEQAAKLAAGEFSSRELTQAHLERIDALEPAVGAYLNVDHDGALAAADAVDAARKEGAALPELAGVPVAVKDLCCTRGQVTTAASKILEGWVPPYDATLVANIRANQMPILGKTNLDEFAMGGSTEHSAFHRTANPWDLERIPGGSSGGSAAALAASRTCSSVPSRMMSDSAASAASRMRRARSPLGQSGSASPPGCGSPAACRFTSRRCRGSTARLPVKDPPSVL